MEGLIRVSIFILYLFLISLLPDLRRVFQYHAAEHKAINALEAGDELVPERVQRYSLIHPRCGTAFLLWVMVIAIFVFAFFGRPAWYWLIATRILLLPLIAGIAYELIRFAGKHTGQPRPHGAARAGAVAAAPDDARADARPDRGLDPGARRRFCASSARKSAPTPASRSWPSRCRASSGTQTSSGKGISRAAPAASAREPARSRISTTRSPCAIGKGTEGKTSPEELLAAAHAGCFATSLAGELTQAGSPPEQLDITSNVVMDEVEGEGHVIVESQLRVRARVAGIDEEAFRRVVAEADAGCSFSKLIKASAKVSIDAELEG